MSSVSQLDGCIEELLRTPPLLHLDGGGNLVNYGIDPRLVAYLRQFVQPGSRTLETGSGISTIVFLLLGAYHRSISPDGGEAERIRAYCAQKGISTDNYTATVAYSERGLPDLPEEPVLDLALVDGNHAFPLPCIDWYFATRILKKGGIVVIDDIQLWSGKILADFLDAEEVWEKVTRNDRFAVYRMLADSKEVLGRWWGQQPFVVHNSNMRSSNKLAAGLRRWFLRKPY
jgi:hypothetical protein